MKTHLPKMAGLAMLALALHTNGLAQDITPPTITSDMDGDTAVNPRSYDEIIIKHKSDKNAKVTIEIKDGQVYVDGKPASEYKDADLSVSKMKVKTFRRGAYIMSDGGDDLAFAPSPFRKEGVWSFDGRTMTGNSAFLGVTSLKPENGPDGAKIGEVSSGSAAEKAGLKQGDLITKIDDITIDGPESLADAIRKYKPEDKVTITYLRDGKEQKATASLGKSMTLYGFNKSPDMAPLRSFKMDIAPRGGFGYGYSYGNNARLGIHAQDTEDGKGVKVLDVDDESAAAKAGVKEGDVITSFDGKTVNSATELAQLARDSRTKPSVHIDLLRGGKSMSMDIKIPRKLKTADL